MTFLAGETTASVSINITDDTTAELTEVFSAVLTIPATATSQGITKGAADTVTISITDDDDAPMISIPTQYSVNGQPSDVILYIIILFIMFIFSISLICNCRFLLSMVEWQLFHFTMWGSRCPY